MFTVLKLAGGAYLIWLGIQALRAAGRRADPSVSDEVAQRRLDSRRAFRHGLFSNLANPKIAAFFTSLLPQFIAPGEPVLVPFLLLGALFVAMTLILARGLRADGGEGSRPADATAREGDARPRHGPRAHGARAATRDRVALDTATLPARGTRTRASTPPPGAGSSSTEPPSASIRRRTIASPRPVPLLGAGAPEAVECAHRARPP